MSFTKSKYDSCFLNQQQSGNKSVFDYVVDNSNYVNPNQCFDTTAGFIAYNPTGVSVKNVDIENDLKGMTRPYTRCTDCQYSGDVIDTTNSSTFSKQPMNVNNQKECEPKYNILPNGYLPNIGTKN